MVLTERNFGQKKRHHLLNILSFDVKELAAAAEVGGRTDRKTEDETVTRNKNTLLRKLKNPVNNSNICDLYLTQDPLLGSLWYLGESLSS